MPRITVIGAGGLGGPIALAAAAGGADVTICDPDVVELSNLHRQIHFTGADLGRPKAAALAARIEAAGGRARGLSSRFAADTAADLAGDADVVVDGSDDPATKFFVADWARAAGRPYVIAAALRYGGNVFTGAPARAGRGRGADGATATACYRCLFEDPPEDAPTCADAGVLGPLVGWIGGVAASHALRLAAGDLGDAGTIWILDDLRDGRAPRTLVLSRRESCTC